MEHLTYDSETRCAPMMLTAPYYNAILPTQIRFVREGITLYVDSLGHIEFRDSGEHILCSLDLPVGDDPTAYAHSAQYGEAACTVDGGSIVLTLPDYEFCDSYPDCDGEYDRWTRRVIRRFSVVFDCRAKTAAVRDET